MKRIILIISFILVNFISFAQSWDELKKFTALDVKVDEWCLGSNEFIVEYEFMIPDYRYKDTAIVRPYTKSGFSKHYSGNEKTLIKDGTLYIIYTEKTIDYKNTKYTSYTCPTYIWKDYKIGDNCFKAGVATISIGALSSIVGGIAYGVGVKNHNIGNIKTGTYFLSFGSTFIGISIPLLCFGDNMKRTTNREYKMYNALK